MLPNALLDILFGKLGMSLRQIENGGNAQMTCPQPLHPVGQGTSHAVCRISSSKEGATVISQVGSQKMFRGL